MDEIKFTNDGIVVRQMYTSFGKTKTDEEVIQYEERDEWEIDFDTGKFVSLGDIVDIEPSKDGGVSSISLQFNNAPMSAAEIRQQENGDGSKEVPPVPDIGRSEVDKDSRWTFYTRMRDNPDSQPAIVREHVFREKNLTQEELEELMEKDGHKPSGSGLSQSLVVLEKVTQEIERRGRGDNKRITWVGED